MQQANAIEFEVRGDGEPVLLIHGAIVADSFLPMMSQPVLSHYQLIRYRRRGYGRSDAAATKAYPRRPTCRSTLA